jgi:hypothetical protein
MSVTVFEKEQTERENGLAAGPLPDEFADSAGVGDQRELSGAGAILPTVLGGEALQGVALFGGPLEAGADGGSTLDV